MFCHVIIFLAFIWEGGLQKVFENQKWALSYKGLRTPAGDYRNNKLTKLQEQMK